MDSYIQFIKENCKNDILIVPILKKENVNSEFIKKLPFLKELIINNSKKEIHREFPEFKLEDIKVNPNICLKYNEIHYGSIKDKKFTEIIFDVTKNELRLFINLYIKPTYDTNYHLDNSNVKKKEFIKTGGWTEITKVSGISKKKDDVSCKDEFVKKVTDENYYAILQDTDVPKKSKKVKVETVKVETVEVETVEVKNNILDTPWGDYISDSDEEVDEEDTNLDNAEKNSQLDPSFVQNNLKIQTIINTPNTKNLNIKNKIKNQDFISLKITYT
jgi:hypothetical protein